MLSCRLLVSISLAAVAWGTSLDDDKYLTYLTLSPKAEQIHVNVITPDVNGRLSLADCAMID